MDRTAGAYPKLNKLPQRFSGSVDGVNRCHPGEYPTSLKCPPNCAGRSNGPQPVQDPLKQRQVRTVAGLGRPVDDD
jgi:hypothetical protein